MDALSLFAVFAAPILYWTIGLPWVVGSKRTALAPLIGCALAGLYSEYAMIFGLPVRSIAVGAIALSAAITAFRISRGASGDLAKHAYEWQWFYWVAILAASLSPFPVLGYWSGDWFTMFEMGQSVLGGDLPRTMLTRPPLFGAAATPLWLFERGLVPFQIMVAVASAGAATATLQFIRLIRPGAHALLLLPLVLTPFFLHHTAAAWPKLLAGALVLVAAVEAVQSRHFASALLFALAIASHEGYIIWLPCILSCHVPRHSWQHILRMSCSLMVAALIIVGPMVLWIAWRYGLAAKIGANPVITDRDSTPILLKTSLGVLATFVGWAPVADAARWATREDPLKWATVQREGYWFLTSWISTLAGTMLGFLYPFIPAVRAIAAQTGSKRRHFDSWTLAAAGVAVVMGASLAGYYASWGMMQSAIIPLALAAYSVLIVRLSTATDAHRLFRRLIVLIGLTGTLPWLFVNAGSSCGLWLSRSVRNIFSTGSESDYHLLISNHLNSLGIAAFPEVPVFAAAMLVGGLLLERWRNDVRRDPPVSSSVSWADQL